MQFALGAVGSDAKINGDYAHPFPRDRGRLTGNAGNRTKRIKKFADADLAYRVLVH